MTADPDDDLELFDAMFKRAEGAGNGDGAAGGAVAPVAPVAPPPPPAPTVAVPPTVADGFFVTAPAPTSDVPAPPAPPVGPPTGGGNGGRPGGRPGRAVPPPTPRADRPPSSNRLEWVALVFGLFALSLGLAMPYFTLLVFINAAAAVIPGVMVVRRSIDTGAPGRVPAAIGVALGVVSVILTIVALGSAGRQVRDTMGQFGNIFGDIELSSAANEARFVELAGNGRAVIELDGARVEMPEVECGFADPAPGVSVAARGSVYEPRSVDMLLISDRLSGQPDVMEITIGSTSYLIAGEGLLAPADGRLLVTGDFKRAGSDRVVPGSVEVTCNR